ALQAISHKKHVLCEKPMALSLSSCQNMAKAAENAGVLLTVAQVLRFWPEYRLVHQQVESGAIGDVKMVSAKRLGQYPSWGEWFKDPEKSGGALMDLHLHDVDFIVSMLGYDVAPIYSVGHQSSSGAFEQMFTLLSFANGTKACVHASNQMPDNYPFTMELNIYGTKGAVELRIGAGYNIHKEGGAESSVNLYQNGSMPQLLIPECDDAYETQLKHFITAVQSGQSSKAVPVEQSLEVIRIMEQIKQALLSGDVVRP
ncbi:MAG: Gfo/Idh/MocA family oxidoreductase, partial [Christensenella sp.]